MKLQYYDSLERDEMKYVLSVGPRLIIAWTEECEDYKTEDMLSTPEQFNVWRMSEYVALNLKSNGVGDCVRDCFHGQFVLCMPFFTEVKI